jgi:hypothetical protein
MALKLTVLISDEYADENYTQAELDGAADQILNIACKHAEFYITRIGSVTLVKED